MKLQRQLATSTMLGPGLQTNIQCSGSSRSFAKTRGWGVQWPAFRSWHQPAKSHHWSWSFYNYPRSGPTTQCRPFYGHLAFKANWKGETARQVGASWANWKSKKSSFWSVKCLLSSLILHNNNKPILDQIVTYNQKCETTSDNQLSGWTETLRSTCESQTRTKKKVTVTVWWCVASLIHYSFLNPGKTITSQKYAQQIQWDALKKNSNACS